MNHGVHINANLFKLILCETAQWLWVTILTKASYSLLLLWVTRGNFLKPLQYSYITIEHIKAVKW